LTHLGGRKFPAIEIAVKFIGGELIGKRDQHAIAIFGPVVPAGRVKRNG